MPARPLSDRSTAARALPARLRRLVTRRPVVTLAGAGLLLAAVPVGLASAATPVRGPVTRYTPPPTRSGPMSRYVPERLVLTQTNRGPYPVISWADFTAELSSDGRVVHTVRFNHWEINVTQTLDPGPDYRITCSVVSSSGRGIPLGEQSGKANRGVNTITFSRQINALPAEWVALKAGARLSCLYADYH